MQFMNSQLSRREFLKLLALAPLLQLNLPHFVGQADQLGQKPDSPNVFILVFDALSAYHMSLFGYRRKTMPNLERFAERATVYHDHYAGGNFTSSGTASLLTGTYPWTHRAIHLHGTVLDSFKDRNLFSAFRQMGYHRSAYSHNLLVTSLLFQFRQQLEVLTPTRELCLVDDQFSDLLFPNDFNAAFWSEWLTLRGSETPPGSLFLSLLHRFYRYFHKRELTQKYGELFPRGIPNLYNMFFILEDAIDWIMAQLRSMPRPFLAYYHLLPPHEPYTTRKDYVGKFRDGWKPEAKPENGFSQGESEASLARDRVEYDEYLAYADSEFGRLYDFMAQNGILENTIFIFTSDHGELFERGIRGHVTPALYQPITRVPLLISRPGQSHREDVRATTSCVDLLPSLLYILNQPLPEWVEGQLLPKFGGEETRSERDIFTVEAKSNPKMAPLRKATVSLIKDRYKLIHYFGYGKAKGRRELYDIINDPEERQDLLDQEKSIATDLQIEMDAKVKAVDQAFLRE